MKSQLIAIVAAVLITGCSDPERKANELFTEASQLVKEANEIERKDFLTAYDNRKSAVELLEKIPRKYPQSSLSVKISKGDFKVQGQSISEIRNKLKAPEVSIRSAAIHGNIDAIKQHIAAGTDVNAKGDGESTPLHFAANRGHKEIVELLIANGANLEDRNEYGETPLHSAGNKKEIVELLVAKGADVNVEIDGGTLREAARKGNIAAVKQHLAAGADVNAKLGGTRRTPLHYAAWYGHKEIAELLITKGADVNAKSSWHGTPLHYAVLWDHKEIVKLLITKGADVNIANPDGRTPISDALDDKPEIADLLRKHGGKTKKELEAEGK